MKTHLITVEGVLRKSVGGAIIPEGIDLYHGLATAGQVVLVLRGEAQDEMHSWLELHGMTRHAFVSVDGVLAANTLRRDGYDIGMVVVAHPEEALYHIRAGIHTLLFTHAQYVIPAWRPDTDKGIRPWTAIVDEAAHVAAMKAKDARLRSVE